MRLYLSSFLLGTEPQHLVHLAGSARRFAVIANALDILNAPERAERVTSEIRAIEGLGLSGEELDLRELDGAPSDDCARVLSGFDGLWVTGGNVFVLRARLARAGADEALRGLLDHDRLVYAGYSAGPCVLGPSLEGLEDVDDGAQPRSLGLGEAMREGLGVISERIVPHVNSPTHSESAALDAIARRYEAQGSEHLVLRDGEALVVQGDTRRVVGHPASVEELFRAYRD